MTPLVAFVGYASARIAVEIAWRTLGWRTNSAGLGGSLGGFGAAMILVGMGLITP